MALGTTDREQQLYCIRHSAAHVLAEAVLRLFPDAKLAIGPPIKNGFYYDFALPRSITPEDLEEIETQMYEIIDAGGGPFVRKSISYREAQTQFANQPYKLEILDSLQDKDEITTYTQNNFTDLCRGPHVKKVGDLSSKAIKLLSVAGAYWRGNENNTMLQRIYGTAWQSAEELSEHLSLLEQIAIRDHRKIGRELDLFSIHELGGPGLIYWHPRGARVRMAIEDYWRNAHTDNGYEILYTPHVGKSGLWERSGHLDFYQENMFAPMEIDNNNYYAKPMNCPFHIMIYQTKQRSFRDLPLRWAELGTVYRYERSGVLHGLLRARGFTQDDAHIFCTPEQVSGEINEVLKFCLQMWKDFGFQKIRAYIATKPAKSIGDAARWSTAENALRNALEELNIDYDVDEGGGAFYGPKIDLKIEDALAREWQMSTVQFDFNLPKKFDMKFVDSDGVEKQPYMIHRALLGSLERFFGILIEHYGGRFPLWLAPYHVHIIPTKSDVHQYAHEVADIWKQHGIRADINLRNDRLGAKIRDAYTQKYPYIAIIGNREQQGRQVTLKRFGDEEQHSYDIDATVSLLLQEINAKH